MVEGPQCHLKAQSLAATCGGQALIALEGSALPLAEQERLRGPSTEF